MRWIWICVTALLCGGAYWLGLSHGAERVVSAPVEPKRAVQRTPLQEPETSRTEASPPPAWVLSIAEGRYFAAIGELLAHLESDPSDHGARFALAEAYVETLQPILAIEQLLAIRAGTVDAADYQRARNEIDAITERADRAFSETGNARAAIDLFESVAAMEPSNDRHRFYLARWLYESERHETADRLLKEMGNDGVTQAEIDDLRARMAERAFELPVRQVNDALFTDVIAGTHYSTETLNLLIDTGATITAIALPRLRSMSAHRLEQIAHVQTAGGMVEMPIYRLARLNVGPLNLTNVRVLGVESLPANVDGLLGLDVIDQLPNKNFLP